MLLCHIKLVSGALTARFANEFIVNEDESRKDTHQTNRCFRSIESAFFGLTTAAAAASSVWPHRIGVYEPAQ